MKGLYLDQWCCIYLCIYTCCWWGNNGLLRGGWTRFFSAMAFPWSTFSILVFLYLCLCVVAGLEGLSHREHEARAHWHCFHFIGCLSFFSLSLSLSLSRSLLLISFGWKGRLLRGGPAKVLSAMVLLLAFLYMYLSFVAGVEGLVHKKHEARALWHFFHFFGCLHYLLLL